MTTVVIERPRLGRPSFWSVLLGVVLGYVFAYLAVGVAVFGLYELGLLGWSGISHPRRSLLDTPYAHAGLASTLADLTLYAAAAVIAAACIRSAVATRTERPVPLDRVFAYVVLAGVPPFFDRGLLPLTPAIAVLATAVLVHAYAVDGAPSRLASWSRRRRLALAGAFAAAVLLALGYGLTHPFVFEGNVGAVNGSLVGSGAQQRVVFRHARYTRYDFLLRNGGFLHARLLSVRAPASQWLGLRGYRFVDRSAGARSSVRVRLLPETLSGCTGGDLVLSRVLVRYRLLGMTFTQAVLLDQPATVVCTPPG